MVNNKLFSPISWMRLSPFTFYILHLPVRSREFLSCRHSIYFTRSCSPPTSDCQPFVVPLNTPQKYMLDIGFVKR